MTSHTIRSYTQQFTLTMGSKQSVAVEDLSSSYIRKKVIYHKLLECGLISNDVYLQVVNNLEASYQKLIRRQESRNVTSFLRKVDSDMLFTKSRRLSSISEVHSTTNI